MSKPNVGKRKVGRYTKTAPKRDVKHPESSIVFVVVRHTRSGDVRCGVHDDEDVANERAESIAQDAANAYGSGHTSVYPARLTLLKPKPTTKPKRGGGR